mmetsp:Transcript_24342/g.53120  ORF Transcript_24342/g.53120 Transcript_24342/m.53120 type:complete len:220 (+) Transcript_24342:111-770(+)
MSARFFSASIRATSSSPSPPAGAAALAASLLGALVALSSAGSSAGRFAAAGGASSTASLPQLECTSPVGLASGTSTTRMWSPRFLGASFLGIPFPSILCLYPLVRLDSRNTMSLPKSVSISKGPPSSASVSDSFNVDWMLSPSLLKIFEGRMLIRTCRLSLYMMTPLLFRSNRSPLEMPAGISTLTVLNSSRDPCPLQWLQVTAAPNPFDSQTSQATRW